MRGGSPVACLQRKLLGGRAPERRHGSRVLDSVLDGKAALDWQARPIYAELSIGTEARYGRH